MDLDHESDDEVEEIYNTPFRPTSDRWPVFENLKENTDKPTSETFKPYDQSMDIFIIPASDARMAPRIRHVRAPITPWRSLLRLTSVMSDLLSVKHGA